MISNTNIRPKTTLSVITRRNGFKLYSKVYLSSGRPCRVFIPPLKVDNLKYYWILYLDNNDMSVVLKKELSTNRVLQVLYG